MKNLSLVCILFLYFIHAYTYAQVNEPILAKGLRQQTLLFSAEHQENISCYRIPALITATNGDLLAAIDERVPSCGDLKWSEDINIVLRRSSDNGKSWSEIEHIVDFPEGQSASDPSFILDRESGEIFLFYNFMDLHKEKDVYYLHMLKSKDYGKSWSKPIDITAQISKPGWKNDFKFITSGRGSQAADGKLLHTLVNLDKGLHIFASDDHGKSWYLIDTPIKPADESKIITLDDGRWMINSRVNKLGMRYVHISEDEGKSWSSSVDSTLIDPACNASIIPYTYTEDGIEKRCLIFSNLNEVDKRRNLWVRISYDEGKSWTKGRCVYNGPAAYSSLSVLKNGDIGLFFEKDEYTQNMFVSFSFDWLRQEQ
ncbi:sialidase family protein [Porifericola rhodea]|uniref:sialidase family protein n=1 Tax=Porifericola rhodea TaxID=930972 RepID=UPI0026654017|nr:sialidase family protein [Porifericola rhodea]WKN29908.1 sialidase family protein [Porifericola rhodea]